MILLKILKKYFPYKTKKLEEALNNYKSQSDYKILKTELLDRWDYLSKNLVYP